MDDLLSNLPVFGDEEKQTEKIILQISKIPL